MQHACRGKLTSLLTCGALSVAAMFSSPLRFRLQAGTAGEIPPQ